jgi:hypothetical protein
MSRSGAETALSGRLMSAWDEQARSGFLLSPPEQAKIETRTVRDEVSGVDFRLRWLPHRELRADVAELERRGIVNPHRRPDVLFRDPRDPPGTYCFLCAGNIREANPMEILVPFTLSGREYLAGANFAWIAEHHFTVMAAEHVDQGFTDHALDAMLDLHRRTEGSFRVVYNGAQAGATIPWHLHFHVTSEAFPVERLAIGAEPRYPAAVSRFGSDETSAALTAAHRWIGRDPEFHRINALVAGATGRPTIHVFLRDRRLTHAPDKGLIGGFEMCGDLVYSEPATRPVFERATSSDLRRILEAVRPPGT